MAKSFLTDLNLNTNVLLNAKIQAWGSDPTLVGNATKTPDNNAAGPKEGMLSSYVGALYIYKGTSGSGGAWLAVGTGTVTSVAGTANQITASGTTSVTLSLATAFGDTVNPYASKTANFVLAAPNGASGVPTFRALVSADIPTLNQNTTGSAGSVANTLTFGTGLTAGGASFNGSAAITITPVSATTSVAGIAQLSDSTSTTSSVLAATATAAKAAYDRGSTGVTNAATAQTTADAALPKAGGTMSGAIAMGGSKITGLGTPTLVDDAVTKAYVDTIATGINAHEAVSYASTANITGTYANGTAGVGATLTGTGSIVIDGYTVVAGDAGTNVVGGTGLRLLLKDQTSTDQNGIYTVTACVSTTSWTLTRAYDYDALGEVAAGDFTYVLNGTVNSKFTFVETSKPAAISGVGTAGNAITFGVFANGNISGTVNVNQGGTGVTTLTGLAYGNGTSAFTAATAAQVVSTISTTAVTNATNAVNVATTDSTTSTTYYPTVVTSTTAGNQAQLTNSNISWNASTAIISALGLTGASQTISTTSNGNISLTPNGTGRIILGGTTGSASVATSVATPATSSSITIKTGDATVTSGTGGGIATAGSITIDTGAASSAAGTSYGAITIGGTNAGVVTVDSGTNNAVLNLGATNSRTIQIGSSTAATAVTITGGSTAITLAGGSGGIALNQSNIAGTITIGSATGTGAITLGSSTAAQTVNIATGVNASTTKTVAIGTNGTSTTNITIGASGGTSTTTLQGAVSVPQIATATGLLKTTITTGVVAVATAGTDYVVPSGTVAKATNVVGGVLGSVPYQSAADTTLFVAPNTSATKNFLSQTGTGSAGALPAWGALAYTDLPTTSLTGVTTDGIARKKTGQLTANSSTTAFAIAHGFGQWVTAQLFDTSGNLVEVDVSNAATGTPAGTTTFTFATAPTTGTNYQYVIIG